MVIASHMYKRASSGSHDSENDAELASEELGYALYERGEYNEALRLLGGVLAKRERREGASLACASIKGDIAMVLDAQGKFDESLKMYREALAVYVPPRAAMLQSLL